MRESETQVLGQCWSMSELQKATLLSYLHQWTKQNTFNIFEREVREK